MYMGFDYHKVNMVVANPRNVRATTQVKIKTDEIDARVLGSLLVRRSSIKRNWMRCFKLNGKP